ncbi:hypothetical protein SAY87_028164 [Trapa incisa]|uniref:ER membrane protein complex subunit 6 n=1 Tax=Trapa incisa TaxID=236973 RepID=A0AAN7KUD8_9MYRT|nr:hypothetical protein SAY87_028164 [Trapa incisa]
MAGHGDSGSDKKSSVVTSLPIFNAENLQSNMKVVYYSRTFMSIIGGVTAGILGFTGLTGFVFYLIIMAITSVGLIAKAGFSVHSYFDSLNQIVLDGFLGGPMLEYVICFVMKDIKTQASWSLCEGHNNVILCAPTGMKFSPEKAENDMVVYCSDIKT